MLTDREITTKVQIALVNVIKEWKEDLLNTALNYPEWTERLVIQSRYILTVQDLNDDVRRGATLEHVIDAVLSMEEVQRETLVDALLAQGLREEINACENWVGDLTY